ncbi:MAG TPA: glycosyltransferase family 2 protein [Hymenobacter sp.]|jgi:glycosyltransferase involved in cell wall biosynthesis|uniref:glycosyltransferase family 2 protein n=1 Tax=Hymenobacter sp. TaxID=1898978 RepID=UPI002ED9AB6D
MKKVSIIIPCYNYGWLLPETLDSVLAQTHEHWECLIINDGSTDNTKAIAEDYVKRDGRFRYMQQENMGMSAARNRGLREATGVYVQLLDADDLLTPQKLEVHVATLENHPSADLAYGDMRYFQHGEPSLLSRSADMKDTTWVRGVQGSGETILNALIEGNIMVSNAPLMRAALMQSVGPFDESLRWVEDWQYWVRCAIAGACFRYVPDSNAWALVRVHPTSTSHNMQRMHDHEVLVRKQIGTWLDKIGAMQAIEINQTSIIKSTANLATHELVKGSVWNGIKRYCYLARTTGSYRYYLTSIPYWLRVRLLSGNIVKNSIVKK